MIKYLIKKRFLKAILPQHSASKNHNANGIFLCKHNNIYSYRSSFEIVLKAVGRN